MQLRLVDTIASSFRGAGHGWMGWTEVLDNLPLRPGHFLLRSLRSQLQPAMLLDLWSFS